MAHPPYNFEKEFLESIIENIPDMIFLKDARELRFVRFNRAGEELLGYSREDLLGKNDYDFFPKAEADFFTEKDREVLEGRKLVDIPEEPIHTRLKGRRILHTKKIPILNEKGEPVYLLGISEDITHQTELAGERRRREELEEAKQQSDELTASLELSKSRLSAVIEGIPDGLLAVEEGQVTELNSAALTVFGSSKSEDLLGPVEEIFHRLELQHSDDTKPVSWEALYELSTAGVPVTCEGKLRKFDETLIDVSVRAAPLNKEQGPRSVLLVVRDITEHVRLESMREEFFSIAAHELKTPLATVKGYVDLMKSWSDEELLEQGDRALDVIDRQCGRLNRLTQELLEVSRIQIGRLQLHKQPIQLDELLRNVVAEMQSLSRKHQITIKRSTPVLLQADCDRIEQVLSNLLSNALNFSPAGGEVQVSLEKIKEEIVISVRDFGIGIPAERQDSVFERFFHAHEGTAYAMSAGLGMGLYLSKKLVEAHGGTMGFESKEGKGSTFFFTLPLSREDSTVDENRKPPSILVVDDDTDLLDLTALALEREGYEVRSAHDGLEALEMIEQFMPSLILLDMRMPRMNGWEFAEEFRARHDRAVPIVVITAAAQARRHAEEIGAEGFISKPFPMSKLLSTVRSKLEICCAQI